MIIGTFSDECDGKGITAEMFEQALPKSWSVVPYPDLITGTPGMFVSGKDYFYTQFGEPIEDENGNITIDKSVSRNTSYPR